MATLGRLSDCSNHQRVLLLLLNTPLTAPCNHHHHHRRRTIRASLHRRNFVAQTTTTALSLSLSSPLILSATTSSPAKSAEDPLLSDWERVYLPVDPGVVLLDIAFVPDDLNHGLYPSSMLDFPIAYIYIYQAIASVTFLISDTRL